MTNGFESDTSMMSTSVKLFPPLSGLITLSHRLQRNRPGITLEIHILHHYAAKVYASGSAIVGHVVVESELDLQADDLQISLTGQSCVCGDDQRGVFSSYHKFLTLVSPVFMPIDSSGVLWAGETYEIPFYFVLPFHVPWAGCLESLKSHSDSSIHVALPSTIGEWEKDDMAPTMVKVIYAVEVKACQGNTRTIIKKSQKIKVLASTFEDSALPIQQDSQYPTLERAVIRKFPLTRAIARVSVESTDTIRVFLNVDGSVANQLAARVNLHFESFFGAAPPAIVRLVFAKIRAQTSYYKSRVWDFPFPNRNNYLSYWTRSKIASYIDMQL